jgi:hypothetical protein
VSFNSISSAMRDIWGKRQTSYFLVACEIMGLAAHVKKCARNSSKTTVS